MAAEKPGRKPMDRLKADAKADAAKPTVIRLWDQEFTVRPSTQWRSSALRALRERDVDSWAETSMESASYRVWRQKDPTLVEAAEFMDALDAATGDDVGESSAS